MRNPHTFLLLLLTLLLARYNAQTCSSCTVNITAYDTLTYVVSAGQTFCIDSLGEFAGTVTLNGGTICNKGTFNPKTFIISTGTINNHAIMIFNGTTTLAPSCMLVTGLKSITNLKADLVISGGSLDNSGIINVRNSINYTAGTFTNSAIVNCDTLSGASLSSITNSGIINKD